MTDEFVELFKRAFVEEQVDALARRQLAGLVFALAALGTASGFGFRVQAAQFRGRVSSLRGFLGFGDLGRGEQAAFGLRQRNLP